MSDMLFAGTKHPGNQLVNHSVPSFPDHNNDFVNYIVAHPDHTQHPTVHAEMILLQRFQTLRNKYPTMILYSWMMPCSGCTNALIQSLENYTCGSDVVIVYTIDWKGESAHNNQKNRKNLRQAGIQVYQVRYHLTLPPVD